MRSLIDPVAGNGSATVRGRIAGQQIPPVASLRSRLGRATLMSAAALALAACGSGVDETLDAVKQEAGAAAQASKAFQALDTAIDEQAVEGLARGAINGAVNEAIGEVLPAEEMAAVRAVVDEEAIAQGLRSSLEGARDARANDANAAQ